MDAEFLELCTRYTRLQEIIAAARFSSETLRGLLRDLDNDELLLVDLPAQLRSLADYYQSILDEKEPQFLVVEVELGLRRTAILARAKELESESKGWPEG